MDKRQLKIAVIGVGLGACSEMATTVLEWRDKLNISLVAVDSAIESYKAPHIWHSEHTKGYYIGVESQEGLIFTPTMWTERVEGIISGSDLVFLLGDMQDSDVLGSVPRVNAIMGNVKALTIGIFRLPDTNVDTEYFKAMDECMQELKEPLDAWLTVPRNPLLTSPAADWLEKNVFRYGVKDIAELVSIPGEITIDISDLQRLLKNSGAIYMSTGKCAYGEGPGELAWSTACSDAGSNPFLDIPSPQGAKRIILKIIGGYHLPLKVAGDIMGQVQRYSANDTEIVVGVTLDPSYNQMAKIIMLASDLPTLAKIEVKK